MSKDPQAGPEGLTAAEELDAYNVNHFDLTLLGNLPSPEEPSTSQQSPFPLADEPFVACWQAWEEEARERGALATLQRYLPQLSFPIREGMSASDEYRGATLAGRDPSQFESATGLGVDLDPDSIEIEIYPSLAGRVPLIKARGRDAFVTLVRALTRRNEPAPIPESMGAQMVGGFNNWHRIWQLKEAYLATPAEERERASWKEEFAWIRGRKELYQDRFIVLSDGPYSAVPAADLGLSDAAWREQSLVLRRDHECLHYFTRRVFGSMRSNLLDELIADYAGLVAATGRYRAAWFLRFIGLEDFPRYRAGGRLDLYRGDPPLSQPAFEKLHEQVVAAATRLEAFDRRDPAAEDTAHRRALRFAALAALRLDELAASDGPERLRASLEALESQS
ncbi:MAG: hypothetical protein AAF725_13480 [Acidobacteriota bacterium]